jgi:predicted alpha/beta-hydrolase family hydrolase
VTTEPHRVTAQHIHGLAASSRMRGSRTILADTEDGLRYVAAGDVLAAGTKVRRMLLTLGDLSDDALNAGLSLPAYLKAHASRIAAELNAVLAENEGTA